MTVQKETTEALNGFCRELVAKVLDLLEAANTNPKLCSLVRETIYDSKDRFEERINGERNNNDAHQENYRQSGYRD